MQWAKRTLTPSTTASLDAALLLGHVLSRDRSWVLAHGDEPLSAEAEARYRELVDRRATGVPVAYLRGYCDWFGLHLRVTPDVLVPRPETELLVERAVRVALERRARFVVDVGTGSGAIAIQLARSLPSALVTGIDTSRAALELARYNAAALGVAERVNWLGGNLLEPLGEEPNLLVANLPYLSDSAMLELDRDVRHEPAPALYGGPDGLDLYRELFQQRRDRGWTAPVLLEIDPRQATKLTAILDASFGESRVSVHRDYAGHDRIIVAGA
ncbi:MAG TPA: peptide chain release factor N(5)-glutamine methyltransferase [Chloroflexota bacterium]